MLATVPDLVAAGVPLWAAVAVGFLTTVWLQFGRRYRLEEFRVTRREVVVRLVRRQRQ